MIDLSHLFSKLVDTHGNILIPGVLDSVLPVTAEERKLYEPIDFDLEKFKVDAGVDHLIHNTKEDTLMSRWRFPSLSIHGVEGAFYGGGQILRSILSSTTLLGPRRVCTWNALL